MINDKVKEEFFELLQIIDISPYNNAMTVSQVLMNCYKNYNLTLPEAETLFRTYKSRIHLVGLPMKFFENSCKYHLINPPNKKLKFKPMIGNKQKKFGLWIEMNGKNQLEKIISKCNKVDRNLNNTGFLTSQ